MNFWAVARVAEMGFDTGKGSVEVKFSQKTPLLKDEIVKKLEEKIRDPILNLFDIRIYSEQESDHWVRILI